MAEDTAPTRGVADHLDHFIGELVPLLRSPLLTVLMLANVALQAGLLFPLCWARYFPMADADVYAVAARNVVRGIGLYPLTPHGGLITPGGGHLYFLYPPSAGALFAPLGYFSQDAIVRVFFILGFLFFWFYAGILAYLINGKLTTRGVMGASLALMIMPGSYFNLMSGQIEPLLWSMFGLAIIGVARGGLLSASCLIKPFAIWPLALAAFREPKRVLPSAIIVGLVGWALGALVCGVKSYSTWMSYTPDHMYPLIFHHTNVSFTILLLRLLGYTSLPVWGRKYLMAMFFVMPAIMAFVMRRRPLAAQYAWVGCAAIIFVPFLHDYYAPILLAPIAVELGLSLQRVQAAQAATEQQ